MVPLPVPRFYEHGVGNRPQQDEAGLGLHSITIRRLPAGRPPRPSMAARSPRLSFLATDQLKAEKPLMEY
ncbi:hypothetical protein EYF80_004672 [Liparis tanakae]|uniref:Uncharacterized protein n=1 Tax=Liparis tanakae TaxID=230148 RepID=A0A4Z2J5T1_9TELE|nr:hypothetical protein EYF80_004672 [Liparis tanakae]